MSEVIVTPVTVFHSVIVLIIIWTGEFYLELKHS